LHNKRAKLSTWNGFYEDLCELFYSNSGALAGRKILLTQNQVLAVAGQIESPDEDDAPNRLAGNNFAGTGEILRIRRRYCTVSDRSRRFRDSTSA